MGIEFGLILIAGIIYLGFFGELIFKKTDIPPMILLIILGLFVGPIFGLINQQTFFGITEFIAAIAVIIILFEGGINMDISKIVKEMPIGSLFTSINFMLSVITTTLIVFIMGFFIKELTLMHGILLGAIVGGTCSATVIPIITKLRGINDKTRMILSIESALTDVFCIVLAITMIEVIKSNTINFITIFQEIASNFAIGIFFGIIAGILWLFIMRRFIEHDYSYITTFGLLFFIYPVVQSLNGSGAIACLTFGIVLGNGRKILSRFGYNDESYEIDGSSRTFHSLITFFIRTFFFFFLGFMVTIKNPLNILFGVIIAIATILIRQIATNYTTKGKDEFTKLDKKIMNIMAPKGLAASVLAYIAVAQLPTDPGIKMLPDIVFTVIIFSAIITTVGIIKTKIDMSKTEKERKVEEKVEEEIAEEIIKKPKVDTLIENKKKKIKK